jgi:hypothetical protein
MDVYIVNMNFCFWRLAFELESVVMPDWCKSAGVSGTGGPYSMLSHLLPSLISSSIYCPTSNLNVRNDSPSKMQNHPPTWEFYNWNMQCGRMLLCVVQNRQPTNMHLTLLDICITAELALCTPSNDEVFLMG